MGREKELPPPLEMMCLNALWAVGEGNVEEVRRVVAHTRPLAYTTVLTLLDRLARRGAVSRRKEGRGFRYQPTVERDKLRRMALKQFLEYHFENSVMKLRIFLEQPVESVELMAPVDAPVPPEPEAAATEELEATVSDIPSDEAAFAAVAGVSGAPKMSNPEA
jgi:BlaI family transcriptional regulator, penicillinase repressor